MISKANGEGESSNRVRKLALPIKAKLDQGKRVVDLSQKEAEATGRTMSDLIFAFIAWVKSWWIWMLLCLFVVLIYFVFGWIAVSAFCLGIVFFYFLGWAFLKGQTEVVDVFDDDLNFDTMEVGVQKWRRMKKTGTLSPVHTSTGRLRYICDKVDWEAETVTTSWVTKLTSFDFLVNFKTFRRMVDTYQLLLDKHLQKVAFPSIFGKLQSIEVFESFIADYDGRLRGLGTPYTEIPDVPSDLVETPDEDEYRRETSEPVNDTEIRVGSPRSGNPTKQRVPSSRVKS